MKDNNAVKDDGRLTRWEIGPDDLVTIHGYKWKYAKSYNKGVVLRSANENSPPATESFDWEKISQLLKLGKLVVDRGYFSERNAIDRALTTKGHELDPEKVLRATMVARFIEQEGVDDEWRSERCHRSDEDIERFYAIFAADNEELIEEARVSITKKGKKKLFVGPRQFRRLLQRFEESELNPASMADNYPGGGSPGSTLAHRDLTNLLEFTSTARTAERPTVKSAWEAMQDANAILLEENKPGFRQVSLSTFQRVFAEGNDFLNDVGRTENRHRIERKYAFKRTGLQPSRPLEIVEMDEHLVHLVTMLTKNGLWPRLHKDVQDKIKALGRVWLSVALDACTRSVCGLKILKGRPDADAAVATLAMVAQQKDKIATLIGAQTPWPQYGTPSAVHTDAGSGYVSAKFELAVMMYTGKLRIPPSKHPHLRGRVERFFRTINQRYIHLFAGQTFSNPLLKDDYDPEAFAHITDEQFADLIARLIVDCYHNTKHRSLGMTPLEAWYRASQLGNGGVLPPPSPKNYREIFGTTIQRSIGNDGINIAGNNYSNEKLLNIRKKWFRAKLLIRLNEEDMSSISVKHLRRNHWIEVPAVFPGLKGVTLDEWKETVRYVERRFGSNKIHSQKTIREALMAVREVLAQSKREPGILVHQSIEEKLKQVEAGISPTFKYDNRAEYDYGEHDDGIDHENEPEDIDAELEAAMGRMKSKIMENGDLVFEETSNVPPAVDEGPTYSRENFESEEARQWPAPSKASSKNGRQNLGAGASVKDTSTKQAGNAEEPSTPTDNEKVGEPSASVAPRRKGGINIVDISKEKEK